MRLALFLQLARSSAQLTLPSPAPTLSLYSATVELMAHEVSRAVAPFVIAHAH